MIAEEARDFIKHNLEQHNNQLIDDITPDVVLYWWKLLNIAVFDNFLVLPQKIHCRNFHNGYYGWLLYTKGCEQFEIGIRRQLPDLKTFLTVLSHEMVHATQVQLYKKADHKKTFFEWREPLKKYVNLPLNRQVYC